MRLLRTAGWKLDYLNQMTSITVCFQTVVLIFLIVYVNLHLLSLANAIFLYIFLLDCRDGDSLQDVVFHAARQFSRVICMPNIKPPVRNLDDAISYKTVQINYFSKVIIHNFLCDCFLQLLNIENRSVYDF